MPLSDGYKSITEAWANAQSKGDAPTDGRIDPDDSSLSPPITLADGWPDTFSQAGGDTPRRSVINELQFRKDSGLLDIRAYGVLPWDAAVDTLEGGIKQVDGVLFSADVDNGPTYGNAISPTASGQMVWTRIPPSVDLPDAPAAPTGVAGISRVDLSWACPADNGAAVTSFDLQWRQDGTQPWTTVSGLTHSRYLLTGLVNGTTYNVRIQATNAEGDSGYGASADFTPAAEVPGGGSQFAFRADTGDASGEVDLSWLAPAANGAPITLYTYQWRTSGQVL